MNTQMKETKHTPGPWIAADTFLNNQPNKTYLRQKRYGGDIIADMGPSSEINPANAALIAAAPELLEACRRADLAREAIERNANIIKRLLHQKGLPITWLDGVIRGLDHSRQAIAKAEGRGE